MNAYLWGSTFLVAFAAVLWLRFSKRTFLPPLSAFNLFLCITASTALTQYALMAERNYLASSPMHALPHLNLLYLGLHFTLVIWLVLGSILPPQFHLPAVWPILFLYSSYLYFRIFFSLEYGTPYPILYAIVLLQISAPRKPLNSAHPPDLLSYRLVTLPPGLLLSLFTFLLLAGVSTALSASPSESLSQNVQIICFALLPFLLARDLADRHIWRATSAWIVIFGAFIWVPLAIIKFSMLNSDLGFIHALRMRLYIAGVGPNLISYPLISLAPLSIGMGLTTAIRWRKLAWGFISGGILLTIAYTQSKWGFSGWIGLLLGVGTMALLFRWEAITSWWKRRSRMHLTTIVAGIVLILISFLILIGVALRVNSYSLYTRLYGWRTLLIQVSDHPLFGSGLGVRHITAQYGDLLSWDDVGVPSDWLAQAPLNQQVQQNQLSFHTHNLFLELAIGAGLLALTAFLWFLLELARHSLVILQHASGPSKVLIAGCIGGIMASLGWGLIDVMEYSPLFFSFPVWALIGLLLAAPNCQISDPSPVLTKVYGFQVADFRTGSFTYRISYPVFRVVDHLSSVKHRITHPLFNLLRVGVFFSLALVFVAMPLIGNWYYGLAYKAYQEHRWTAAADNLDQAARWEPLNAKYQQLRGEVLINLGQYSDAINAYERAAELKREFSPYYSKLGWLYWLQGNMERAITNFQKAVELDPLEVWLKGLHADLGLAYVGQGLTEEAIQLLKKSIELDPQMALAPYWVRVISESVGFDIVLDPVYSHEQPAAGKISDSMRARVMAHLGKADYTSRQFNFQSLASMESNPTSMISFSRVLDAIEVDRRAAGIKRGSESPRLTATLADAAQLVGLNRHAESTYLAYKKAYPRSIFGYRELGKLYRREGRLDEAQAILGQALKIMPDDTDSLIELMNVYLDQARSLPRLRAEEKFAEAQQVLDVIYQQSPLAISLYVLRAQIQQEEGDLSEAADTIRNSLVVNDSIPNRLTLASLYRQLDEQQQASNQCILAADALFHLWPRSLDPQLWNAGVCLAQSNTQINDLKKLKICESANAQTCNVLLGHIHRVRGEFDQALVAYQAAVKDNPDDGGNHYLLGQTFQAMGQPEAAEVEYRRAVELAPQESLPLIALGRLQWEQGREEAAIESFRAAVAATPGWGEAHTVLGNALLDSNDLTGAAEQYRLAQVSDGDVNEGTVYAFIAHLADAKIQSPGPSYVRNDYFTINSQVSSHDEQQRVLFMHPNSRVSFSVTIPVGAKLAFDVATAPESWTEEGDGVGFAIYIVTEGVTSRVFSTYIDPKHNLADQGWHPYTLDLSAYAGKSVTFIFETNVGPAGDDRYDWAGWGEPRLMVP